MWSVTSGAVGDQHDDEFGGFVPPDDRVWRHPAEIGALMAAANAAPAVTRRPWGVAMFSALGGALVVATVFVAIGQLDPDLIVVREQVAVQTVTTEPRVVEPDEWADTVGQPAQPAVVGLTVEAANGTRQGSGLVLRDDGHLVTTAELVANAESIAVALDGDATITASVVDLDPVSSLAVLHVDKPLPTAVQAASMDLEVGDHVAVVGSDASDIHPSEVLRVGATVVDRRARPHHDLAVLDAELADSQLGGAVVSDTGAVVGLAIRVRGSTYEALVVPIEVVASVSRQIIEEGAVQHAAWLGADVSSRSGGGVDVNAVIFDGPGFTAGVRTGDVITDLDGDPITSSEALVARLRAMDPADDVTLTVLRGDGEMQPIVTLGRRPLVD